MQKAIALAALLAAGAAFAGTVTWQCDMNIQIALGSFIPGYDQLVVRGNFNDWSGTNPTLTDPDNDGIYTGSYNHDLFPNPFDGEYKYVIRYGGTADSWEFVGNRPYTYLGTDLLLPVDFYNNVSVLPGTCDVEITFQVDMNVQVATGAFNPMTDLVVVRGGTPPLEWGGTTWTCADQGGGIYAVTIPFPGQAESNAIEHKFVIVGGGDNWESSPNRLAYGDCDWVDSDSDGFKEGTMPVVFFANVGWDNIVDHDVLVTFDIDASRISCWFANGGAPTFDGLSSYAGLNFISVHGFFNGWPAWDGNINAIYRSVATGPCSWTVSVLFPTGSAKTQIYKLGANGFDNEAGFGQDHSMDLSNDMGTGLLTINVEFGSNGTQWDCFDGCYETVDAQELPTVFALGQNVPNPFNPVTTIAYTMGSTAAASLTIHDLSGARVATLVNGLVTAGQHEVSFDASSLASGVYVYMLQSEGRVESRKMLLVK